MYPEYPVTFPDGSPWNFVVDPALNWLGWMEVGEVREFSFDLSNIGYNPLTWEITSITGPAELMFGSTGPHTLTWQTSPLTVTFRVTAQQVGPLSGMVIFTTPDGYVRCSYAGNVLPAGASLPESREVIIRNRNLLREDADGDYPMSFELYNKDNVSVNLQYWSLTNDPADLTKWVLPDVTLQPGGSVVVFASGKNRPADPQDPTPAELHTNFLAELTNSFLVLTENIFVPLPEKTITGNQLVAIGIAAVVVGTITAIGYGYYYVQEQLATQTIALHVGEETYDIDFVAMPEPEENKKYAVVVVGPGFYQFDVVREGLRDLGYNVVQLKPTKDLDVMAALTADDVGVFVFSGHGFHNGLKVADGNDNRYDDWLQQDEIQSAISLRTKPLDFVMLTACCVYYPSGNLASEDKWDAALEAWRNTFDADALIGWKVAELDYMVGAGFEYTFFEVGRRFLSQPQTQCNSIKDIKNGAWTELLYRDVNHPDLGDALTYKLMLMSALDIYNCALIFHPEVGDDKRLSPYLKVADDPCGSDGY